MVTMALSNWSFVSQRWNVVISVCAYVHEVSATASLLGVIIAQGEEEIEVGIDGVVLEVVEVGRIVEVVVVFVTSEMDGQIVQQPAWVA